MTNAPTFHGFRDRSSAEAWVSIDDVAAHLGVRKDSVYRWIEQRGLPAQKVGKLWKLKLSEVDAWMHGAGSKRAKKKALALVPEAATGASILLVDDDEVLRELLAEFLSDQGYSVLQAADGAEALAVLRSAGDALPSLIILDLVMPVMDGWQFRKEQARDAALEAIPVLLVTAERRLCEGPDVLWKPFDLSLLRAAVRRLLEEAP